MYKFLRIEIKNRLFVDKMNCLKGFQKYNNTFLTFNAFLELSPFSLVSATGRSPYTEPYNYSPGESVDIR